MLTKRSGYGRNGGGFCVGVVVVVAFAVLAAIAAIGPARAHAYFDPSSCARSSSPSSCPES